MNFERDVELKCALILLESDEPGKGVPQTGFKWIACVRRLGGSGRSERVTCLILERARTWNRACSILWIL